MTSRRDAEARRQLLDHARPPCPGGPAPRPNSAVAHGVVPCARSPSTVADPVVQRRPTARYCIGDRSCASSSTTWPSECVRCDQVRRLVDQHRVGRRPLRRLHAAGRLRPQDRLLLLGASSSPSACAARNSASRQQPQHQLRRIDRRPDRLDGRLHRRVAGHRVLHPVVRGLAGPLHLHQHGVRDALRQGLVRGAVPDVPVQQLPHDLLQFVRGHPPAPGAADHHHRLGRQRDVRADGPAQHLRHPRVALDHRGRPPRRCRAPRRGPPDRRPSPACTSSSPSAGSTCSM